jgi:hypothetical protein
VAHKPAVGQALVALLTIPLLVEVLGLEVPQLERVADAKGMEEAPDGMEVQLPEIAEVVVAVAVM